MLRDEIDLAIHFTPFELVDKAIHELHRECIRAEDFVVEHICVMDPEVPINTTLDEMVAPEKF